MMGAISGALDAYLQSELVGNALPVAWENVAYDPQTGSPYLRTSLSSYSRINAGSGQNPIFLEKGSYTITVVWPAGSGKAAPIAEAEKIKGLFPRGLSLALAGQAPLTVEMTSLAPGFNDGDWMNIPVIVTWMTNDLSQ